MMNHSIKKLLVLSSGGDAPGMNAGIRAVVRTALQRGLEVYGTEMGYHGLIQKKIFKLNSLSVANIIQHGGTILKTGRCLAFREKSTRDHCREFLAQAGIDALIVLGGDGSFTGATLLQNEGGPRVIGIPCTIDNDIAGTEYCIGFDTACNTAINAIDKIRDTAFSLSRNFIVEVMGRASGFIAVEVGMATGAEIILTPEFPLSPEEIVKRVQHRQREKIISFIVAAESNQAGHSFTLAEEIKKLSGLNYKVSVLGYIQRGGAPTIKDRVTASIMGVKAVEGLLAGKSQQMLAMKGNEIFLTPFPDPKKATRFFTQKELLKLNELICES